MKLLFIFVFCVFIPFSSIATDLKSMARQRNNEGMESYNSGNYYDAIQKFQEAISLDNNYLRAYLNWAATLCKMRPYPIDPQIYDILDKTYKINPQQTLAAIHKDSDFAELRMELGYSSEKPESNHGKLAKGFLAYEKNLRSKTMHFIDKSLGISFDCPGSWVSIVKEVNNDSLIREIILCDSQNPRLVGEGEPGSSFELYLIIEQHNKKRYKREQVIDYENMEPMQFKDEVIYVAGLKAVLNKYVNGGPEGEKSVIRRIEIENKESVYVFYFSRTFGADYKEIDQKEVEQNDKIMDGILKSAKFE